MNAPRSLRSFGQVFDSVAEDYDKARAGYPPAVVDAAMERGALRAGSSVLEIGCGTGKLTELLVARGLAVDAVDPGANMIDAARRRLGDAAADVRFHIGTFEELSFPDEAFAALFSATAFHWVDPAVSWSKSAAVLEEGGLLALVTHLGLRNEHSDEHEDAFHALLRKHAPHVAKDLPRSRDLEEIMAGVDERRANASAVWDWVMGGRHHLAVDEASTLFEDVEVVPFVSHVEYTADEMIAQFRTTSLYFQIDPARRQAFEDEDRRVIERRGGKTPFQHATLLMTARRS
jgi:ubiquinone/menaquinone biosynthesis C-methylase UbiE